MQLWKSMLIWLKTLDYKNADQCRVAKQTAITNPNFKNTKNYF